MSEKRCYYEVLGVERTAPAEEIRKAYRQSALKNHPDRNPGNAEAEGRFKEATEAFQVLSDDDKRVRYDRFGHAGLAGGGQDFSGDIFSHFQDIFSEFFGGGQPRRRGPTRGPDVRVQQRLSLKEVMLGCKRELQLRTPVACDACSGSGAKPGTKRKSCGTCDGAGQVSVARGFVMFTQTCPECSGEGSVVKTPCDACNGAGAVEKPRKVLVTFPAGIDGGKRLRIPGQGLPGPQGGQAGDLFVHVEVMPEEGFERDGADLYTRAKVSFTQVALGTKIQVPLPDGTSVEVEVPSGTQPGETVVLRGSGIPRVDARGRGQLFVIVDVSVPKDVSARARELLQELASELDAPAEKRVSNA